ncbi:hypothetical protein C2845_PM04G02310 [Panicum miliaceum]|uniref:Uncharacterized protein n=1 Tax=Panicum miliaceum TaxID=4540 RepID=A0A3L6QMU4_PANMI|nr:hypothetical protein C2845_PM04G02310 [Panicum miliaceum]
MEVRCRRLEGKVAVVTASTQGIGLAISERLGLEGAAASSFCGSAWESQENVDEAVEGLRGEGIAAVGAVWEGFQSFRWNFGHIDILASNAAANPTVDGILQMKEAVLDKPWNINVKASILLQEAAPHLRKGSSVIIISSIGGYNPKQGLAMYCVTKTALFGLTKRKELIDRTPLKRLGSVEDMAAAAAFLASEDASFITAETIVVAGGMQSRL